MILNRKKSLRIENVLKNVNFTLMSISTIISKKNVISCEISIPQLKSTKWRLYAKLQSRNTSQKFSFSPMFVNTSQDFENISVFSLLLGKYCFKFVKMFSLTAYRPAYVKIKLILKIVIWDVVCLAWVEKTQNVWFSPITWNFK